MKKAINIDVALEILFKEVKKYTTPVVDLIAVQTKDPYKVLTATILSARTKDEVTAKASERLFQKAPDIQKLGKLSKEEISKLIYPVGFYKSKADYLTKLPEALKPFFSEVPREMEQLLTLPGVGRKTANLVLAVAFKIPAICVDTHVHRIMNIWGYVQSATPLETEMLLRKKLPEKHWLTVNSLLVAFGQGKCRPVSPHCQTCPLESQCPQIGVVPKKEGTKKPKIQTGQRLFISWNVNGLRAVGKKGFSELLTKANADIFAVQETKAHPDQLPDELKKIPGYHSFWASAKKKGYSGVGVYSKEKPIKVIKELGNNEFDGEGRMLALEFETFFFVNVYFPNAQHKLLRIAFKLAFNKAVKTFLDGLPKKKSVVICGDFNVAHKEIDLKNPEANKENPGFSIAERAWMDSFTEKAGYVDTFRKFNKEPEQYTWWSYRFNARERNIGWRIDYFLVDKKSGSRVLGADILPEVPGSDHCPVSLVFKQAWPEKEFSISNQDGYNTTSRS
ncbi:MAG: exodeoxyribonuclease III [Nitrospinota bacterium]